MAQTKGTFETHDFDNFRLHVYHTNDALGDASYIVEGTQAVVTLEQPLFRENVAEYDAYLDALGKPVEARIADYHVGGTGDHATVMPAGMPAFTKDAVYDGMMRNFAQTFGDAIVDRPTGATDEVAFGTTQRWAGIPFRFDRGAATDFPAASILIGGKVCYTHWAPTKAHANSLQISSPAAVDAEIAEARRALASGAELFIGGHGGAAGADAVRFKIDYLECVKRLLAANGTADEFARALRAAYPELPGSRNETSDAPIQKNTAGFRSSAATRAACQRLRTTAARRKRRHGQQTSKSLLIFSRQFQDYGTARLFVVVTPYDLDGRIVRHVVGIGSRHAFGNGHPQRGEVLRPIGRQLAVGRAEGHGPAPEQMRRVVGRHEALPRQLAAIEFAVGGQKLVVVGKS